MSQIIDEIREALLDEKTIKVISTVDRNGIPYSAFKGSLHFRGNDLVFYDLIQSSKTNKNLVNAIWFEGKAAVNILTPDRRSYLLIVKPIKAVTCGHEFEDTYVALREKKGDIDLNTIWYLEIESAKEQTFIKRLKEDEEKYPVIRHIDRLLKE